jgi:hypothetical protein
MPYAFVATRLSPTVSTTSPHLRILSTLDRFVGDKLISVLPSLPSHYKESPLVTRTPAPITIPIKKPLKSSLGCSNTGSFARSKETAAPTKPNVRRSMLPPSRKSVRFKDEDVDGGLESICVFRATGRPSALLNPDSDTESDAESNEASSFPYSECLVLAKAMAGAAATAPLLKVMDISPIPSEHIPPHPFIYLESISPLTGARPPLLRGIVRVRNIAYEKRVAARFTVDNWTTASEALARYAGPPGAHDDDGTWDRFAFSISLEFNAPRPPRAATRASSHAHGSAYSHSHSRSHAFPLLLAVRFSVPGVGEWWDNNGGNDFRVVLAHAHQAFAGSKTPGPGVDPTPAAEFLRRPQGVTCFADAQAAMGSLLNAYVAPAPTEVTN